MSMGFDGSPLTQGQPQAKGRAGQQEYKKSEGQWMHWFSDIKPI
jgi:hypothetical protein